MYSVRSSVRVGSKVATARLMYVDADAVYKAVITAPDENQDIVVKETTSSDLVKVIQWIAKETGSGKLAGLTARKLFANVSGYLREVRNHLAMAKPAVKTILTEAKAKGEVGKVKIHGSKKKDASKKHSGVVGSKKKVKHAK